VAAAGTALIAVLLQAGGGIVRETLAYDRSAIGAGEVWRLLSAHFVHLGWSHLLLNLAGLALVSWIVGRRFDWARWIWIGFMTIAAIDAGFWFFYPELEWYVGLSGVLHGLLVAGLFAGLVQRDREAVILTLFVIAKLAWEQLAGPLPGSESSSGGVVIVDAHLYGAIGGLAGALLCWRSVRPSTAI
jgi:rhomboid family GlyGly-CTERM serine protease